MGYELAQKLLGEQVLPTEEERPDMYYNLVISLILGFPWVILAVLAIGHLTSRRSVRAA
jgi:hypothetical protein